MKNMIYYCLLIILSCKGARGEELPTTTTTTTTTTVDTESTVFATPQTLDPNAISTLRPTTKITRSTWLTPFRLTFEEDCDYAAYYCMRAYNTGKLCARTMWHIYHNFPNYCMLNYVNCMERYDVWQVVHMGACFDLKPLQHYRYYPYNNDNFLDEYTVRDDLLA